MELLGISYVDLPDPIAKAPSIVKRLESGETVQLSHHIIRRLRLHECWANEVYQSLLYQLSVGSVIGVSFLTHRQVQYDALRSISAGQAMDNRNQLLAKHLQTIVPFLGEVGLNDVVKLRRREEEAFIRFRAALRSALREATSDRSQLNERDARDFYTDVIAPPLPHWMRRSDKRKRI